MISKTLMKVNVEEDLEKAKMKIDVLISCRKGTFNYVGDSRNGCVCAVDIAGSG